MNNQTAPWPETLASLVEKTSYKDGWSFALIRDYDRGQGSKGTTLDITVHGPDGYHPDRQIGVRHLFIVPAAAYNDRSWSRWLLDQILLVERHEACEFFTIGGEHPYAPHHGNGEDPYTIFDLGTAQEAAQRAGT